MSSPRKKKSSRNDQQQEKQYQSVLGDNLSLIILKDTATQETSLPNKKINDFPVGGRRSTDIDDEGLYEYWKSLTEREQDVLIGVCMGLTDAEIGSALNIGIATVKSNIQRIFLKVYVRNRRQIMVRFRKFAFPRSIPRI